MNEVPFYQREAACRLLRSAHWPLEVGGVRVGIQAWRARSVPGFFILKVPRFGRGIPTQAIDGIVRELAQVARNRPVLRLHLEAWTDDTAQMELIRRACEANGFRASAPRSYTRTIWIELLPDMDETLMRFPKKVRRDVRVPEKKGFHVRQIRSGAISPHLQRMMRQSFARTGVRAPRVHWRDWIRLSVQEPGLLRVVGLFDDADVRSERPLAFAAAVRHGDVAEYAHAGTAEGARVGVPLLYAPTWSLMCWARSAGAHWWDFGGVTTNSRGEEDGDDPRAGISAFKLYFSKNAIEVGREWALEPRPWLAKLTSSIRSFLGK